MNKVLMIAYHYPPEGGSSGVLRTLKFSKYLPSNGWIPHILTLREAFYPVRDNGLIRDIPPEATVHRTFALDSSRHLAFRGKHLALLTVPDRFISWLPFGVARGLQVIRKEAIHALYSTSPPATAHLIAASLKAVTGLPWVADFRDPWVEEGFFPIPGTIRYRIESALERAVVRRADRLVVTTPYLRDDFLARYPELPSDKVRVISNGYDEEDFQGLAPTDACDRFEIIHAGLLTPEFRDPFPLLEAVVELLSQGILPREKVRVTFLGGGPWVASGRFTHGVERMGLGGVVRIEGQVSHREALRRMAEAAVLLLLQASEDTRSLIPAKAFEYLRSGKPILALTLEGATADLLKDAPHCFVVKPSDPVQLRNSLLSLYSLWRDGPRGMRVSRPVAKYARSHLTTELKLVLDDLKRKENGATPR